MIPGSMASLMMGGRILNPRTVTYLAAMSVQPSAARQILIDNLINSIDAAGLFSKLDGLYLFKAHDSQAARVNVAGSNDVLSVTGTPTFTTDAGVAGSTSAYYSMGANINALSYFAQNSNHVGIWSNTNANVNAAQCGTVGSNGWQIVPRQGGNMNYYASVGTISAATVADSLGHLVGNRSGSGSGNIEMYKDGSSLTVVGGAASSALAAIPMSFLRGNSTSSGGTLFAGHLGSSLNSTDVTNLRNALNTYLNAF